MPDEAAHRDRLTKRVYRGASGESIPYRLWIPSRGDPREGRPEKCPLVLFLHGAGERGSNNESQLDHPEVLRLAADDADPCFLVAPQCPRGQKWVEVPWHLRKPHQTPREPSAPMRLTIELLACLEDEFPIDPQRRYVTGMSMGGFGVFDLLVRRPHDFAAAVPICGGADESRLGQIAHVPMWVFHGRKDLAVPVIRSRSAVEALRAAGAEPRYTEYPRTGHNAWSPAYREPELREWLLRQHR
jgi:predicted peptidase